MKQTDENAITPSQADWLTTGGEMGRLIREKDWSRTPVGPLETWPQSLKTAVSICLGSRSPIVIWWGKQALTQFYNDGYISFLGETKHPAGLGQSGRECWSEIWHIIDPMFEGVFATGEATWSEDFLYVIDRNLPREEGYFTFSYSPIWDDNGTVAGIFCACYETTGRVIGERRLQTLHDLGRRAMEAKSAEEACKITARILETNPADIPFALIYLLDDEARLARLVATAGLAAGNPACIDHVHLREGADQSTTWPLGRALATGAAELVSDLASRFGPMPGGPWPESSEAAVVLPIAAPGQAQPTGFLVAGLSPRRVVDTDYSSFFDLIGGHLATVIATARAHEEERKRAEALAEIDRLKTAFFSNVSHEFRTPLTLMLGPLEDALAAGGLSPEAHEGLEVAHRNSLRLLKLVNTLLDFSRIEAGRIQAVYEPVDLTALTANLASVFRSAIERAGMRLIVDCPPLGQPVYVDREMWEKIVLNLISNAFKFTLEGEIEVSMKSTGGSVELTVRDTGAGIPAAELPHIFDRFHRVKGISGRSYEGSGIGLALVQELVKLHGGTVRVTSEVGRGSAFIVSIPLGKAHLPADHVKAESALASSGLRSDAYVEEALRWLPEFQNAPLGMETTAQLTGDAGIVQSTPQPASGTPRSKVLLADDNADIRDYIRRLLGRQYEVVAVADGEEALKSAR
jgi:signal transduction histidine kinase